MNRKIFIDCGFFLGNAIKDFKSTTEYSPDFIYYGFDPIMNLEETKKKWPNVTLDNKAIWINDGEIDFYTSNRHGGRANGAYHNKRASREKIMKVKCFDFSTWLKNNFDDNDYIILKMDIEGGEYEVVPKMIKDATIDLIDLFYLEWHGSRMRDANNEKCIKIMGELKRDGLIIRKSIERHLLSLRRQAARQKAKEAKEVKT